MSSRQKAVPDVHPGWRIFAAVVSVVVFGIFLFALTIALLAQSQPEPPVPSESQLKEIFERDRSQIDRLKDLELSNKNGGAISKLLKQIGAEQLRRNGEGFIIEYVHKEGFLGDRHCYKGFLYSATLSPQQARGLTKQCSGNADENREMAVYHLVPVADNWYVLHDHQ